MKLIHILNVQNDILTSEEYLQLGTNKPIDAFSIVFKTTEEEDDLWDDKLGEREEHLATWTETNFDKTIDKTMQRIETFIANFINNQPITDWFGNKTYLEFRPKVQGVL